MLELVGEQGRAGGGELADHAFAELYREQLRPMVRLAHLLTAGSPAAEELVQDAFVAVHRRWSTIEQPTAYLRRTVVNAAASHRRRVRLEERHASTAIEEAIEQPADELRDAIAALPSRQRAAVVLRYYEDLPESEIAEAMGCRVPAVKSLLHRALQQLREVVEP